MYDFLDNKAVLITGGTGFFGEELVSRLLKLPKVRKVVIYSRDEFKQHLMAERYDDKRLRCYLGDIRDLSRLKRAFEDIDYVIHAAALKQVPILEENPFEAVKTNIQGSQNVIEASLETEPTRVLLLSTDKACAPLNLYGATKLVAEKLFVDANSYVGKRLTTFAVVRYGNVINSRGSVVPLFKRLASEGKPLPITDPKMTRFWVDADEAVHFVLRKLPLHQKGLVYIPKLSSVSLANLAEAISPNAEWYTIGCRPGEKMHEELISPHESSRAVFAFHTGYVLEPDASWHSKLHSGWKKVPKGFSYSSKDNLMTLEEIRDKL